MAAVMAPLAEVEEIVAGIDGYVVLANINSTHQVVLGGATEAVAEAVAAVQQRGHTAIPLPVSHGFHTEIVAPASEPLRAMLQRLGLRPPAAADRRERHRRALSDGRRRRRSRCSTCSAARSRRRCSS